MKVKELEDLAVRLKYNEATEHDRQTAAQICYGLALAIRLKESKPCDVCGGTGIVLDADFANEILCEACQTVRA